MHREFHSFFKTLKDTRGYYDVFLITPGGDIVYSVYKELDYATNLVDGAYAASGLGDVFRAARDAPDGRSAFVDFAAYAPSYGAPASFIARQIRSDDGAVLGVLAFQMPVDRLDALVGDRGHGVHAMVIGSDTLLRTNDSRFGEGAILTQAVQSPAIAPALAGTPTVADETRAGTRYLQSAAALDYLGTHWVFMVEIDRALAFAPLDKLRNTVLLVALGCLLVAALCARWLGRSIAQPISRLADTLRSLIDGNRDTPVPFEDRRDEIGAVATSVGYFKTKLIEMDALQARELATADRERAAEQARQQAAEAAREAERAKDEAARKAEAATRAKEARIAAEIAEVVEACAAGEFSRRLDLAGKEGVFAELCTGVNRIGEVTEDGLRQISAAMTALSRGDLTYRLDGPFQGTFARIADDVNQTMDSLGQLIATIRDSSRSSSDLMLEVSEGAQRLARRTETNAAALEESSAALTELEHSVKSAAQSAGSARSGVAHVVSGTEDGIAKVKQTMSAMEKIQESSTEISKIVDLIDGIAFQTNLLALNAGVEAARAGEAGRGFAVVANEVRELAARSADAAREISALITESVSRVHKGVAYSEESMQVLEAIGESIREVARMVDELATSSAEQSVGIAEIASAVNTLDTSTQQNAAMFAESTAVTKQMQIEIGALISAIGTFVTTPGTAAKAGRAA